MAADLIIREQQQTGLGNWSAPLAFMARQTLELALKALLEATAHRGNVVSPKVVFSHHLDTLWEHSRNWLKANGYQFEEDLRCEVAEWLITNFHAVDPSGDLFRFAHSKLTAYGRLKTYDRASIYPEVFVPYFEDTYGFLRHWEGVLMRECIIEELEREGMEYSGQFDPDDFPRRGEGTKPK